MHTEIPRCTTRLLQSGGHAHAALHSYTGIPGWTRNRPCLSYLTRGVLTDHQGPSGAINGHQKSSETSRGHQGPSTAINGHHAQQGPINVHDAARLHQLLAAAAA